GTARQLRHPENSPCPDGRGLWSAYCEIALEAAAIGCVFLFQLFPRSNTLILLWLKNKQKKIRVG
ncbi:MAG: hypothetical protein K2X80_06765, partial [Pseudomonadaceae bacterium]|nr:hypothetical protein [Pseudomonadaceae bacterium]